MKSLRKKISEILIGLSLTEVNTYHLTNDINLNKKMNTDLKYVELENALTSDYNILRSWLLPNALEVLSKNKHNEYPQKIFEIGKVFNLKNNNIEEVYRLVICIISNKTDFTEIKQILDNLFNALNLKYEIKDTDHNSFIPGRIGRVSVKGKEVAYIGEIHPKVLENWNLEIPITALELNLSDLFNL